MNPQEPTDKTIKEKLGKLELSGRFVFHGSPHVLEKLEPRQSKVWNEEKSEMIDAGKPAVSASQFVDVAIFRSLFNKANDNNRGSAFSYQNGRLCFKTNSENLEKAKTCVGYVYVFNKEDFEQYSEIEYRSEKTIKPIEVLRVELKCLSDNTDIVIK